MPSQAVMNARLNAVRSSTHGLNVEPLIDREDIGLQVFTNNDMNTTMIFLGNKKKYSHYHSIQNKEKNKVLKLIRNTIISQTSEKVRKEAMKRRDLEVGDVLVSSWGYSMTIVDFYQVTELVGDRSVKIRKISSDDESTGWLCGKSTPIPDSFIGGEETRVVKGNRVKISDSSSAVKIIYEVKDGEKVYHSYNFNHAD